MTKKCNLTLSRWHKVAERLSREYPKDDKYCDAAAGYRSAYDASSGIFQYLPWVRDARTRLVW